MDFMTRCWTVEPKRRLTMVQAAMHVQSINETGALLANKDMNAEFVPLSVFGRGGSMIRQRWVRQSATRQRCCYCQLWMLILGILFALAIGVVTFALVNRPDHKDNGGCKKTETLNLTDVVILLGGAATSKSTVAVYGLHEETELYFMDQYAFLNLDGPRLVYHTTVQINDHELLIMGVTWARRSVEPLPQAVGAHAAVKHGSQVMVCGGFSGGHDVTTQAYSAACFLFDTSSEKWSNASTMHNRRDELTLTLVMYDDTPYVYAIGGKSGIPTNESTGFVMQVERMRFPDGDWTILPNATVPDGGTWFNAAAALGTDVYVCGGHWEDYCNVLDTEKGIWKPDRPSRSYTHGDGLSLFSHDRKIYLLGGEGYRQKYVSIYNTETKNWTSTAALSRGVQFASTVMAHHVQITVCVSPTT